MMRWQRQTSIVYAFISAKEYKYKLIWTVWRYVGRIDIDGVLPATSNITPGKANIDSIKFNANDVQRAIKKMKSSISCGPDDLSALLFKNISACIAEQLSLIVDSFMSIGKTPDEWKSSIVTLVYKSDLSSDVSNYRPISLTCVCWKIMERVINTNLLSYLRKQKCITKAQHGF